MTTADHSPNFGEIMDASARHGRRVAGHTSRKRVRSRSPENASEQQYNPEHASKKVRSRKPPPGPSERRQHRPRRVFDRSQETSVGPENVPRKDGDDILGPENTPRKNHKTKRDRKENPSSRIHSLRKLIDRGTLPPPVQAEKERELSTLLYEREKKTLKQASKRNLERYHFIRFMERQKAQRILKQLRRSAAAGLDVDKHGRNLKDRIDEAEVDLNYTLYAPLGEKYRSIFAGEGKSEEPSKTENRQNSGNSEPKKIVKPPGWYEVEAAMKQGTEKLEALRDRVQDHGKDRVSGLDLKSDKMAKHRRTDRSNDGRKIESTNDDGVSHTGRVTLDPKSSTTYKYKPQVDHHNNNEDNNDDDDDDDDTSDGDGGFFERRG